MAATTAKMPLYSIGLLYKVIPILMLGRALITSSLSCSGVMLYELKQ